MFPDHLAENYLALAAEQGWGVVSDIARKSGSQLFIDWAEKHASAKPVVEDAAKAAPERAARTAKK